MTEITRPVSYTQDGIPIYINPPFPHAPMSLPTPRVEIVKGEAWMCKKNGRKLYPPAAPVT